MNDLNPTLIEITIDGHDLVVPEGTTIAEAKIMVENAENAGTQNIPLEDWEYTRTLEQLLAEKELFVAITLDQTPPIIVHDSVGKEYYTCESTTDLHKYIRTLSKDNAKSA